MKFLILFAVAAVFGSVHCDEECFRAIFKECIKEPVPMERMTLCDEIQDEMECIHSHAKKCKMPFWPETSGVYSGIQAACVVKNYFDKDKTCYQKAVNESACAEPMNAAMKDIKTDEDIFRSSKEVCHLFDSYSSCVQEDVHQNCHGSVVSSLLFDNIFTPLRSLSDSLCGELILPADVKDNRPDNFARLNVYQAVLAIFAAPS